MDGTRTGFGAVMVKVAVLIIAVEIAIMLIFEQLELGLEGWQLALLDAGMLTAIVGPLAYLGLVRPRDQGLRQAMRELEEARTHAERLARIDSLTTLLNRRALFEVFEREWERAERYGHALSCVILDLDRFKDVNDRFGHKAGDMALVSVGEVLIRVCRSIDFVGRYGGEEFVVVLPETDLEGAAALGERIRVAIAEAPVDFDGKSIPMTVSVGAATRVVEDETVAALLDRADRALFAAKGAGRDRVEVDPGRDVPS